jgi:hypothetical protein
MPSRVPRWHDRVEGVTKSQEAPRRMRGPARRGHCYRRSEAAAGRREEGVRWIRKHTKRRPALHLSPQRRAGAGSGSVRGRTQQGRKPRHNRPRCGAAGSPRPQPGPTRHTTPNTGANSRPTAARKTPSRTNSRPNHPHRTPGPKFSPPVSHTQNSQANGTLCLSGGCSNRLIGYGS